MFVFFSVNLKRKNLAGISHIIGASEFQQCSSHTTHFHAHTQTPGESSEGFEKYKTFEDLNLNVEESFCGKLMCHKRFVRKKITFVKQIRVVLTKLKII